VRYTINLALRIVTRLAVCLISWYLPLLGERVELAEHVVNSNGPKDDSEQNSDKKRSDWVYGTVNVTDGHLTVHYDPMRDAIEIEGAEPGSTRTETSYPRSSGKPKVVSSVPTFGSSPFTTAKALLDFDRVIAVDTNTHTVDGVRWAICSSYYVPEPLNRYRGEIPWLPLGAFLIRDVADGVNPERIGWHLTLQNYLPRFRHDDERLAIVVDSELGQHQEINTRKAGYYGSNLLPPRTALIYASSDKDKNTLQGTMIRACDAVSMQIWEQLSPRLESLHVSSRGIDPNYHSALSVRSPLTALPL